MAQPTNRKEFADYCLRKLGADVLDINISQDQVQDRIDEALNLFHQHHYEGSEKQYMKYTVTEQDKTNKYISMPTSVLGVVGVLDVSTFQSSSSLFNANYQFAMNDLFNLQNTSVAPYYLAMRHIDLLNYFFSTQPTIRFNMNTNRLFLDDWTNIPIGTNIVLESYVKLNEDIYPSIWSNLWLQQYTTALLQEQWGRHMKKFKYKLPNGVEFSGQETYEEAKEAQKELLEDLHSTWSLPINFVIG